MAGLFYPGIRTKLNRPIGRIGNPIAVSVPENNLYLVPAGRCVGFSSEELDIFGPCRLEVFTRFLL